MYCSWIDCEKDILNAEDVNNDIIPSPAHHKTVIFIELNTQESALIDLVLPLESDTFKRHWRQNDESQKKRFAQNRYFLHSSFPWGGRLLWQRVNIEPYTLLYGEGRAGWGGWLVLLVVAESDGGLRGDDGVVCVLQALLAERRWVSSPRVEVPDDVEPGGDVLKHRSLDGQ